MPSIEELLAANIAATEKLATAVSANTAALLGAAPTPAPAPAKTPKEKPVKATPAAVVETEPVIEVEATPEPEPETPVEEAVVASEPEKPAFPTDRGEALVKIQELVKDVLTAAGPAGMQKKKDAFTKLREKWGVQKVSEITDDSKLEVFYDEAVAVLA